MGRPLDRPHYSLAVEDTFDRAELDPGLWIPAYLPHWTTADRAAARYDVGGGSLRLRIDADQPAWSPELTGGLRVSSLQTGVFSGPVGSGIGQHRFRDGLVVREAQRPRALFTPRYGRVDVRACFPADPTAMAAIWMIGYEDEPDRSAELCIAEIFGRDVEPGRVGIGMGIRPFHDPRLVDDFTVETVGIDVREPHTYTAAWTPDEAVLSVDGRPIRVLRQAPDYPMQLLIDVFEFRDVPGDVPGTGPYPKRFVVESVRGWTLRGS